MSSPSLTIKVYVMPGTRKTLPRTACRIRTTPQETYRNKRGPHHGYVLHVEETIDGNGNGILTSADYQPNNVSDSAMAKNQLASMPDDGQKRTEIADGAYSGDEISKLAEEKNVNLFTTNLTGKLPDESMADFEISEDGKSVLKCPKGHAPYSSTWDEKHKRYKVAFSKSHCANCPFAPYCKGHDLKRKPLTIVYISPKTIARARTVRFLGTNVAKAMACKRNGIEGVMSVLCAGSTAWMRSQSLGSYDRRCGCGHHFCHTTS